MGLTRARRRPGPVMGRASTKRDPGRYSVGPGGAGSGTNSATVYNALALRPLHGWKQRFHRSYCSSNGRGRKSHQKPPLKPSTGAPDS
ncbi:hypothetical protein NL676_001725 [Syzygium grande]|nr:hypothetical protein NL676_001725 [Syzygium grande]